MLRRVHLAHGSVVAAATAAVAVAVPGAGGRRAFTSGRDSSHARSSCASGSRRPDAASAVIAAGRLGTPPILLSSSAHPFSLYGNLSPRAARSSRQVGCGSAAGRRRPYSGRTGPFTHHVRFYSTATPRASAVAVTRSLARPVPFCGADATMDRCALSMPLRFAANSARSGGKDIDVADADKPTHIRVADQRDSQVYTYTEYVEKFEREERASKSVGEALSEARDNPAWMLWALGFLSMAVLTVVVSVRVRREQMRFDPKLRAVKSFDSDDGPSIGGPFTLTDVNTGRTVTEQDFLGKWLYIYFGFTNCPDVCPEEMAKMSRVINHLDKKVGRDYWQPIFVSLDPQRDTPKAVREYLSEFSPRILGLVGTPEQVEEAARQYRVYFARPDEEAMSEDDYLIDHSIIMYLMDPAGNFSDYTTKEFQWFESYSKLLRRMMDYEKAKKQQPAGTSPVNERVANVGSVIAPSST